MQVDPIKAGFSQAKLARIDRHLIENYIAPGKIAGCQVMVARRGTTYIKSFGDMIVNEPDQCRKIPSFVFTP